MSDRITAGLKRLFEDQGHRIVFWYDADRDLRGEFDEVELAGVEKLEIANNEFGLKYRMLRQQPNARFLLYKEGAEPAAADNWLLDVQLASAVFKADQAAIWVAELGIPAKYEAAVREHPDFYRSQKRLERLRAFEQDKPSRSEKDVRRKMLAVCASADGDLDTVIEALLGELADGQDESLRLIARSGLMAFFWKEVEAAFGYAADQPDFQDFAIALFDSAYHRALGDDGRLNAEASLMFRRWANNRHWAQAFETLSQQYQELLKIDEDLQKRDFRLLMPHDHFDAMDRQIIRSLVEAMATQTVNAADVLRWVRERRQSHWYKSYEDIYQAIGFATEFQQALAEANLTMNSVSEGVKRYAASWYKLDQLYRKFIHHMLKSGQAGLLRPLYESVEKRYTTNFVLAVNDAWQDQVNRLEDWEIPGYARQRDFYREQAAEFRRKDQKVVVIISDALRYEVAEECLRKIRELNRFDADLKPMISSLPSYTQLGMASLLPSSDLSFKADGSDGILSGGESTQGLPAREKILAAGRAGDRAKAMRAEEAMNMAVSEGKELFRDHDIIYIYHNQIDAAGDKVATEGNLCRAVEDAIDDLVKLVRKLTSANVTNILITADHGFLYQHQALDESDFALADPQGDEILSRNRRFVLGRGLKPTAGMKKFTSAQLGLSGDVEVLIPNSINRLRRQGSGSRYVHGGASLQEIVIPVLRVGKQRNADITQVSVQIIAPGKSLITSGQIAVSLYQVEPVSEKMQGRVLLAGLYAEDGAAISDAHELTFDFRSENAREREMPRSFLLNRAADGYNGKTVYLKLRERVGKTTRFQDYASHPFQLKRNTSIDLDF